MTQRREAVKRVKEERARLDDVRSRLDHVREAQVIVQDVAQWIQNEAHQKIASIVSRCLGIIFDIPYQFVIYFDKKRGKTEARLMFQRKGREIDPVTSSGGGVLNVAAFALRLASLILSQPPRRRLLVLDEPFAMLSEQYRPRVAEMLLTVSKELGVQIVQVTHSEELEIGKIVRIS